MKKTIIFFLICLKTIPSIAQDSVRVNNPKVTVNSISDSLVKRKDVVSISEDTMFNNKLADSLIERKDVVSISEDTMFNNKLADSLIEEKIANSQESHIQKRPQRRMPPPPPLRVVSYDSIIHRDSVLLSKVEGYMAEMTEQGNTIKGCVDKCEIQIEKLQSHIVHMHNIMWAIVVMLILCVIFFFMVALSLRHRISKGTASLVESNVDGKEHDDSAITTISEDEVPTLSDADVVAYNDAIQAFVNIDNYIYDLKKHNALITPYMRWLVSNCPKPNVDTSTLPDEERTKVSLLASKIEQFKKNHEQAIQRYLIRSKSKKTYDDCIRCPLNGTFNSELDQHLLGDDLSDGEKISSVYKIGYHFPDSKAYPYREKSLIL